MKRKVLLLCFTSVSFAFFLALTSFVASRAYSEEVPVKKSVKIKKGKSKVAKAHTIPKTAPIVQSESKSPTPSPDSASWGKMQAKPCDSKTEQMKIEEKLKSETPVKLFQEDAGCKIQ